MVRISLRRRRKLNAAEIVKVKAMTVTDSVASDTAAPRKQATANTVAIPI